MNDLRQEFENETGIDIHLQTTEEENYKRLWEYIRFLENKMEEFEQRINNE